MSETWTDVIIIIITVVLGISTNVATGALPKTWGPYFGMAWFGIALCAITWIVIRVKGNDPFWIGVLVVLYVITSILVIVIRPQRLRIFLAYSSKDKADVRQLAGRLRKERFDVWIDEEDLIAGQVWEKAITKALDESDAIIVCLSNNALYEAQFLRNEIAFAVRVAQRQHKYPEFIFPVRLDNCLVPSPLSTYQWVNLYEETGFAKLLRGLNNRQEKLTNERRAKSLSALVRWRVPLISIFVLLLVMIFWFKSPSQQAVSEWLDRFSSDPLPTPTPTRRSGVNPIPPAPTIAPTITRKPPGELVGPTPDPTIVALSICSNARVRVREIIGRTEPSITAEATFVISENDRVEVACNSERNSDGLLWVRVRFGESSDGQGGWVPLQDLRVNEFATFDTRPSPIPDPTIVALPICSTARVKVREVISRIEPSTIAEATLVIRENDRVEVACNSERSGDGLLWVRVRSGESSDGQGGWVPLQDLEMQP